MNVELAMRTLEVAKANPSRFDMDTFFRGLGEEGFSKDTPETVPPCGTTACYAGFASLLAAPVGSRLVWTDDSGSLVQEPGQDDGEHVETYAIKALDITDDQANTLFYLDNIDQVERAVKHLAENPDADGDVLCAVARRGNA